MKSSSIVPIKWTGGKKFMTKLVKDFFDANHCEFFVEPFCGGAASSFAIRSEKTILNDINSHLINFYRHVQSNFKHPSDVLLVNDRGVYIQNRALFNKISAAGGQLDYLASLFYYLNKTCFNGLCRYNKGKGEFNVPFGSYKTINYKHDFSDVALLMKGWQLNSVTYSDLIIPKNSFVYIDPPYDDSFSDYTTEGFTKEDQEKVVAWASSLGVPVLMSNLNTEFMRDLFTKYGFQTKIICKKHTNAADGEKRKYVEEIVAFKNAVIPASFPITENWTAILKGKKIEEKRPKSA